MTTRNDEELEPGSPGGPRRSRRPDEIGWSVYQQISGVIAAIGLAAMASHLFNLRWRGVLATLVGLWGEYVRPTASWLFHTLISAPLEWAFGWHFEVPLLARDYLSIGIITALSLIKTIRKGRFDDISSLREAISTDSFREFWPSFALWLPAVPIIWPFTVGYLVVVTVVLLLERETDWTAGLLTLSPLFYLGLLLALNYFVLR